MKGALDRLSKRLVGRDSREIERTLMAGDVVIRDRVESRGWHDFHDPQVPGNVAHIRARRANGHVFDLTVDRCTGQVLGAEAVDNRSAQAPDWRYREQPRYRQY